MNRNAEHETRKDIAAAANEASQRRPVGGAAAFDIARTDDQVSGLDSVQKIWEIAGIMREIGVHFKCGIVLMLNSVFEPGDVRRAETQLACAVHNMHLPILRRNLIGQPTSPGR